MNICLQTNCTHSSEVCSEILIYHQVYCIRCDGELSIHAVIFTSIKVILK